MTREKGLPRGTAAGLASPGRMGLLLEGMREFDDDGVAGGVEVPEHSDGKAKVMRQAENEADDETECRQTRSAGLFRSPSG